MPADLVCAGLGRTLVSGAHCQVQHYCKHPPQTLNVSLAPVRMEGQVRLQARPTSLRSHRVRNARRREGTKLATRTQTQRWTRTMIERMRTMLALCCDMLHCSSASFPYDPAFRATIHDRSSSSNSSALVVIGACSVNDDACDLVVATFPDSTGTALKPSLFSLSAVFPTSSLQELSTALSSTMFAGSSAVSMLRSASSLPRESLAPSESRSRRMHPRNRPARAKKLRLLDITEC